MKSNKPSHPADRGFWQKCRRLLRLIVIGDKPVRQMVLRTGLLTATLATVQATQEYWVPSRGVTAGEAAMLTDIFGRRIDTSKIRIHSSPAYNKILHLMDRAAHVKGNLIVFDTPVDDFSKAGTAEQTGFLHEATHIWQKQNRSHAPLQNLRHLFQVSVRGAAEDDVYGYTAGRDFCSYNVEQQASIVADYFTFVRHGQTPVMGTSADPARYRKTMAPFLRGETCAR